MTPEIMMAERLGAARWTDDPRTLDSDAGAFALAPAVAQEWATLYWREDTPRAIADLFNGFYQYEPFGKAVLAVLLDLGCTTCEHEAFGSCLVLPVTTADGVGRTLSLCRLGHEVFYAQVTALVALPKEFGRPIVLAGIVDSIGELKPDSKGRVHVSASGWGWLLRQVEWARTLSAELTPALVRDLVPAPEMLSTLVIDPDAVEWRPGHLDCALGAGTKEIVCLDSAGLAQLIDTALRRRDRLPPLPKVFGPAKEKP